MLIELAILGPMVACWYFQVSARPMALLLVCLLAIAFVPPRSLLRYLEESSGGRVRFSYAKANTNSLLRSIEESNSVPKPDRFSYAKEGLAQEQNGRISVFLTIDDAPSPYTHHILDALKECGNGHALFFVIGDYAQKSPDGLEAIVQTQRHALGNHDMFNRFTAAPWRTIKDIRDGLIESERTVNGLLETMGWEMPNMVYFRPGCGLYTSSVLEASKKYRTLLGDVYGHDCQMAYFPAFLRWFYPWRVTDESIVILHDGTEQRAKNAASVIRAMYYNANVSFIPLPGSVSPKRIKSNSSFLNRCGLTA